MASHRYYSKSVFHAVLIQHSEVSSFSQCFYVPTEVNVHDVVTVVNDRLDAQNVSQRHLKYTFRHYTHCPFIQQLFGILFMDHINVSFPSYEIQYMFIIVDNWHDAFVILHVDVHILLLVGRLAIIYLVTDSQLDCLVGHLVQETLGLQPVDLLQPFKPLDFGSHRLHHINSILSHVHMSHGEFQVGHFSD